MSLSKQEDVTNAQAVIPCNVCENDEPGQRYCIECKQTLCMSCAKSHRKVASTKDHNIILRTQIGDIESEILCCSDHGEPASVHCEKCNTPVCIKCVTGNHQGHKMVQLPDKVDEKKQLLQEQIDNLQEYVLPDLVRRKKEITAEREKYEKAFHDLTKDVESERKSLLRGLDQTYKEKLNSLHGTKQSHIQVYQDKTREVDTKIQFCEERISQCQNIIRKSNFASVINFTVEHNLVQEEESEPELPMPPVLVPGNVEDMIESLKTLQINCPPPITNTLQPTSPIFISTFKSPLKGTSCIAITIEGCVWLGGCNSKELVMVNMLGETLRRRSIEYTPTSLAVMDSGHLFNSTYGTAPLIKIHAEGGEYALSNSCDTFGVSVTPDQNVLLCTIAGILARCDANVSDTKQIYKGSGECSTYHAIESTDGKIYVSDMRTSKVVVLNKEGSVVSKLKTTSDGKKFGKPAGLAFDKKGNILFADKGKDCVFVIDKDKQIRELVGRSHGIREPRYLAFDNEGHLWVTSYTRDIKIVKFLTDYC